MSPDCSAVGENLPAHQKNHHPSLDCSLFLVLPRGQTPQIPSAQVAWMVHLKSSTRGGPGALAFRFFAWDVSRWFRILKTSVQLSLLPTSRISVDRALKLLAPVVQLVLELYLDQASTSKRETERLSSFFNPRFQQRPFPPPQLLDISTLCFFVRTMIKQDILYVLPPAQLLQVQTFCQQQPRPVNIVVNSGVDGILKNFDRWFPTVSTGNRADYLNHIALLVERLVSGSMFISSQGHFGLEIVLEEDQRSSNVLPADPPPPALQVRLKPLLLVLPLGDRFHDVQRRPHYKSHLACMIILFLLSTIHIALAYAWAFITDGGDAAIYEVFSLRNPLPVLYGPDEPRSVHRIGVIIKVRYTLATEHDRRWRPGLLPLSGSSERAAVAVCVVTTFFTNVLAAGLAGEVVHYAPTAHELDGPTSSRTNLKLAQKVHGLDGYHTRKRDDISRISPPHHRCRPSPATPTVSVLICIGAVYHIVAIAPTLIIVRVGLGVSTDDVDKCVTITSSGATQSRAAPNAGRAAETLELRVRPGVSTEEEEVEGSLNDTKR
ncbi:hypothetical protein FB451DRAFT_1535267 [Mycena latifolia]|nr:hypothetical protein FB451DRAFT_1535267 [Mycena latifolia]